MIHIIIKNIRYGIAFLIFQLVITSTVFANTQEKVFENLQDVQIAPIAKKLLTKEPHLLYGGAKIFDMDGGWIGIGVGIVEQSKNKSDFEISNTRQVATAKATEALIRSFAGSKISNVNRSEEHYDGVKESYEQEQINTITEEIKGSLPKIQPIGSWVTDNNEFAMVVMTGTLALDQADLTIQNNSPQLNQAEIQNGWQEIILQTPWILEGGVTLCKHEGKVYLLVIESAKTSDNPSYNAIQMPVLMDAKARNSVLAYLKGVNTDSRNTSEVIMKTNLNEVELSETMNNISKLHASGFVNNIKNIGKWFSGDKSRTYFAYVVPLGN